MNDLTKFFIISGFIIVDAIFESLINEKMSVQVVAPSRIHKIASRVLTMAAGGIIALIISA